MKKNSKITATNREIADWKIAGKTIRFINNLYFYIFDFDLDGRSYDGSFRKTNYRNKHVFIYTINASSYMSARACTHAHTTPIVINENSNKTPTILFKLHSSNLLCDSFFSSLHHFNQIRFLCHCCDCCMCILLLKFPQFPTKHHKQ